MAHKNNKYSVNSRLNDHDAQLLELRQAINSVKLSPGPQGAQGQTGASGSDGRNGNDGRPGRDGAPSTIPGPPGRAGLATKGDTGRQGEKGEKGDPGKDGVSIKGDKGDKGDKGERGDVLIMNETELQQAVIALRIKLKEQHAAHIAVIIESIEGQNKNGNWTAKHFVKLLEGIKRDIERLK